MVYHLRAFMLRIASKAESVEKFIRVFSHFCDRDSFFIVTRKPKPEGTETRFAIHLKTGEPVISGRGTVEVAYADRENPYQLPGMKLRFVELYGKSAEVIERLVVAKEGEARAKASAARDETDAVLERLDAPRPPPKPPAPKERAGSKADQVALAEAQKVAVAAQREERVKGSDFVLPANPFGELTDTHLEAFVECSLYEDVAKMKDELEEPSDLPTWWPERASVRTLTGAAERALESGPPAAAPLGRERPGSSGMGPAAPHPGYAESATPPPGVIPGGAPVAPGGAGFAPMRADTHPPGVPVGAPYGHEPHARESKRPVMLIVIVAVALTALLTLGAAYIMWGAGSSKDTDEDTKDRVEAPATGQPSGARNDTPEHGAAHAKVDAPASAGLATPHSAGSGSAPDTGVDPDGDRNAGADGANQADDGNGTGADTGADIGADTGLGADDMAAALAALEPGRCLARLVSEPEGADVFAGSESLGATPVTAELACGDVELAFKKPRREPTMEKATLIEGQVNDVMVRLDRPRVTLVVTSIPPKAEISINGKSMGPAPVTTEVAAFRAVTVEATKTGYKTYKTKLTPKADDTVRVRARLARRR